MSTPFIRHEMTKEERERHYGNQSKEISEEIAKLASNGSSKYGLAELMGKYGSCRRRYLELELNDTARLLEIEPFTLTCLETGVPPYPLCYVPDYILQQLVKTKDRRGLRILYKALERVKRTNLLQPVPNST